MGTFDKSTDNEAAAIRCKHVIFMKRIKSSKAQQILIANTHSTPSFFLKHGALFLASLAVRLLLLNHGKGFKPLLLAPLILASSINAHAQANAIQPKVATVIKECKEKLHCAKTQLAEADLSDSGRTTSKATSIDNSESLSSMDEINQRIKTLDTQIKTFDTDIKTLDTQTKTLDTEINTLETQIKTLDNQIETLEKQKPTDWEKLDELDSKIRAIRDTIFKKKDQKFIIAKQKTKVIRQKTKVIRQKTKVMKQKNMKLDQEIMKKDKEIMERKQENMKLEQTIKQLDAIKKALDNKQ